MSVLGLYRHEKIVEEETPKAPSAAVEMIALWTKDMEANSYDDESQPKGAEPVVDSSPEAPESTVNNEASDKGEEIQDPEVQQIGFNGREFASRSLESVVKTLRRGREIAAAPVNLLDNASQFVSVRALTSIPNFERRQPALEIEDTDDEVINNDDQEADKDHKKLKKVAGSIGAVLLTAAAGYAAYRGYSHYFPNRAHETLQQAAPTKAPFHQPAEVFSAQPPVKFQPDIIQPISPSKHELVQQHAQRATAKVKTIKESLQFRGDTIWSHVQERVRVKYSNLSEHQRTQFVIKFTRQALRLNPKIDPNNMPLGASFELPSELAQV